MFGLSCSAAIHAKGKFFPLIQVRLRPSWASHTIPVFVSPYFWMLGPFPFKHFPLPTILPLCALLQAVPFRKTK
ncbi:hypothetical protein ACEE86_00920, partial [Proteus mirabilis]